jgi:hypothetical protein
MPAKRWSLIPLSFVIATILMGACVLYSTRSTPTQARTDPMADIPASGSAHPACQMTSTLTLAAYQAWFGLPNHLLPPPYTSTDTTTISRHLQLVQDQCVDGFVVDWYGPLAGLANDRDRSFIDQATATLLEQAETTADFKVGLMYDEGTLRNVIEFTTTRVISDLLYATRYFTSSHYLTLSGRPTLFIFPYPDVDRSIDWSQVRQQLGVSVTLLTMGPNTSTPITYTDKLMVGGVWPGFYALSWDKGRCMERRCGQTWSDTWNLARQFRPPVVLIETWNDFEEGTDIEYGVCTQTVWQEDFDPPPSEDWIMAGAVWEDIPATGSRLREADPNKNYGKAETPTITTSIDSYPFLLVSATEVEPGASYTIQILDKDTGIPKDVLKDVISPGVHLIDLAREMGWQGKHSFTINIWIGGEGKSATFDLMRVQSGCRGYVPTVVHER